VGRSRRKTGHDGSGSRLLCVIARICNEAEEVAPSEIGEVEREEDGKGGRVQERVSFARLESWERGGRA
jgi:hypothetical protein